MRSKRKPKKGFTIIELLVVASLFTVIGTVVAMLFTRGNSTYRHGETHIEMQRSGRSIVARLTPYLSSVFNAASPSANPILVPAAADPNIHEPSVRFVTTEDWLSGSYPSQLTSATLATSTLDLRNFTYQIRQDSNGDVLLERLNETSPGTFAVTNTKTIQRQKKDESISNLQFTLVRSNLLLFQFETSKETRSTSNTPMTVKEDFRITYNLPTKGV